MLSENLACGYLDNFNVAKFPTTLVGLKNYSESYDEVFIQIGEQIRHRKYLQKLDISALAAWKRLDLSTRWMSDLQSLSDSELRRRSQDLFDPNITSSARIQRVANSGIPGFGGSFSVASTVLSAYDPYEFGITDTRSRDSLKFLGCTCGQGLRFYSVYLSHLHFLRDRMNGSHNGRITSRHIDQILFTQSEALTANFNK